MIFSGGIQSALAPGGVEAQMIANIFWWMTGLSVVVWIVVVALAIWAARAKGGEERRDFGRKLILMGGVVPAVLLLILLVFGLRSLPPLIAAQPESVMRITVYGEQWWWRVRYEVKGAQPFELANEIWLPEGEPVEFVLKSNNVIHSFWVPSLAGKMDLVPGRENRLPMRPTRSGVYRGACAEYCGRAHAQMAFYVVVRPRPEFERWFQAQSASAKLPAGGE